MTKDRKVGFGRSVFAVIVAKATIQDTCGNEFRVRVSGIESDMPDYDPGTGMTDQDQNDCRG